MLITIIISRPKVELYPWTKNVSWYCPFTNCVSFYLPLSIRPLHVKVLSHRCISFKASNIFENMQLVHQGWQVTEQEQANNVRVQSYQSSTSIVLFSLLPTAHYMLGNSLLSSEHSDYIWNTVYAVSVMFC